MDWQKHFKEVSARSGAGIGNEPAANEPAGNEPAAVTEPPSITARVSAAWKNSGLDKWGIGEWGSVASFAGIFFWALDKAVQCAPRRKGKG